MSHPTTLTQISALSDPVHADGSISEYAAIRCGNPALDLSSCYMGGCLSSQALCQYLSRDCWEAS